MNPQWERDIAEIKASKRRITPPGAVVEAYSFDIPKHLQDKITAALRDRPVNDDQDSIFYPLIAKAALWLSGTTLFGVVIGGVWAALHGNIQQLSSVVQACQVLAFIGVTVLGYHGYKGRMLFKNPLQKQDDETSK